MNMLALLVLLLLWCSPAMAQVSGALPSYNDAKAGSQRSQQYKPEGDAFVCVNGTNRFTRALYGGHTEWRMETSDRPVFALYKNRRECRNVCFILLIDNQPVPLDSTDYCRAAYTEARRSYVLRDLRFGDGGELHLDVVACPDGDQGVFRFHITGIAAGSLRLRAVLSTITATNFSRMGDLGADKPGGFEAKQLCSTLEWEARDTTYCMARQLELLKEPDDAPRLYRQAEAYNSSLASRIRFVTPDPYINTLGGAIAVAADGDWDGKTWLHGCIGWRMPLAGWRAAYAGDVLGWPERARSHFDAYARSQVTDVPPTRPHPSQDPAMNMARAEKAWGTQMYSNGYICRNPERNDQMHHYDMNLNYIDELLWHFQYDADTLYMRQMWPVLQRHLTWEKRNYDPDGDHLYDAYCCIWASDALYYSGGAVTHSSAYNYRANRLAARIAELIGEDPQPYADEADAILNAINQRLWLPQKGHWAEYQDAMGLKRLHESAAVWSIYTPIDCGACSPQQAWLATDYVTREIPHIFPLGLISTSNWMPYSWSINNVAPAETMHTALAYFESGRADEGYRLLKASIMDNMYYGQSPANFGQLSHYDAARGECYRDFGDVIGISSRALIQGLFGIIPDALNGQCIIRPGFPESWDSVTVTTPYLSYTYARAKDTIRLSVTQHFAQPLTIIVRQNLGNGQYRDIVGNNAQQQEIAFPLPSLTEADRAQPLPSPPLELRSLAIRSTDLIRASLAEPDLTRRFRKQDISQHFNARVDDIFKNSYASPRPPVTTLQIPLQGVGEWCHPQYTPVISDSVFRTLITDGQFIVAGVPFRTPAEGSNIVYTSLWDNYPDAVVIPMKGKASAAWLLMAGSTNHMQSRIDNALVVATYRDGTADTLSLRNPDNWCPIEQDYYVDGKAFQTMEPRPYRVCFGNGVVSRDLGKVLQLQGVYGREIPGGAAQMLCMPLNSAKRLESLTLRTLSNDVVVGLMAVTLQ